MEYTLLEQDEICLAYKETRKGLDKTLRNIVQLLDRDHAHIATAESCTGGMLSAAITSVPGASHVFELGICTYASRMKTELLGVPAALIQTEGVVSAPVAAAMAEGLAQRSGAELCLSVTGLAGPGGGTPEQPVGTVFAGILWKNILTVAPLQLWRFGLQTRAEIRDGAMQCIFGLTEQKLMEEAACKNRKNLPPDRQPMQNS